MALEVLRSVKNFGCNLTNHVFAVVLFFSLPFSENYHLRHLNGKSRRNFSTSFGGEWAAPHFPGGLAASHLEQGLQHWKHNKVLCFLPPVRAGRQENQGIPVMRKHSSLRVLGLHFPCLKELGIAQNHLLSRIKYCNISSTWTVLDLHFPLSTPTLNHFCIQGKFLPWILRGEKKLNFEHWETDAKIEHFSGGCSPPSTWPLKTEPPGRALSLPCPCSLWQF